MRSFVNPQKNINPSNASISLYIPKKKIGRGAAVILEYLTPQSVYTCTLLYLSRNFNPEHGFIKPDSLSFFKTIPTEEKVESLESELDTFQTQQFSLVNAASLKSLIKNMNNQSIRLSQDFNPNNAHELIEELKKPFNPRASESFVRMTVKSVSEKDLKEGLDSKTSCVCAIS